MNGRFVAVGVAALCWIAVRADAVAAQASDAPAQWTLLQAVRTALDAHPTVRLAAARAQDAAAEARIAAADRLPQLALRSSAVRFQEPMIVAPLHGFDVRQPPVFDQTLIQGNVSLSYTLFDGGARGGHIGAARAQADAAELDGVTQRMAVMTDVTRRYLAVLSGLGVLDAYAAGVAALRADSLRVSQLFAEERVPRVTLLQVQAALAQAEAERIAAEDRLDADERALARALGVTPEATRSDSLLPVALADTGLPEAEFARAGALSGNPRLASAKEQIEAARAGRRAAVAQWLPQLDLVGGYLGFGSGAGDFAAEWQGGVRLTYPLFTGGARAHRARQAGARVLAAEQRYEEASLQVADAVDQAIASMREARARVQAGEVATQHLEEVARIEQLRVSTGAGTETDYLRAEADSRRARAALVEARHAEIASRVELARLTGELSEAWLARQVESEQ
jgi:outer membrane protein TolC